MLPKFILFIIVVILIIVLVIHRARSHNKTIISGGKGPYVEDEDRLKKKTIKAFEDFCYPKSYKLQAQQDFVRKYFSKKANNPSSVLIFHKIGSGKTCTAIQIGKAISSLTTNAKGGRPLYLMPASLIPGFYNEVRSPCGNLPRRLLNSPIPTSEPGTPSYKKEIAASNEEIDEHFQVFSYNTFASDGHHKTDSDTPAIIVDEVQNINNPKGTFYNAVFSWIKKHPKASIIIMSATPLFDNTSELYGLAKLLYGWAWSDPKKNAKIIESVESLSDSSNITPQLVKKLFHAKTPSDNKSLKLRPTFTSFYAGAPDFTFPETHIHVKKCEMSAFQTKWYKSQVAAELTKTGKIRMEQIANNFYIKSRQRSNVTFPKGLDGKLSELTKSLIKSDLAAYSCKWAALIKKLNKGQLSFIYTAFTGPAGIEGICHILKAFGWKDFMKDGPGPRRFAIWSGDESLSQKDTLRATFNDPKNNNASQIQIVIGSPAIKEGVSLFRVRQVHIMEAYWNHSRLEQIYGRAVRYCSHKRLDPAERRVDIYIYAGVTKGAIITTRRPATPKNSIDLYMLDMADKKRDAADKIIRVLAN